MTRAIVIVGLGIAVAAAGCGKSQPSSTSGAQAGDRTVVVYSSADKEFAEQIFRAYEAKTRVNVLPLYDTEETKTAGLTARLVGEKDHPKADVFWSSDTSRAVALVDQNVAESYIPEGASGLPVQHRQDQADRGPALDPRADTGPLEGAVCLRQSTLRYDVISRGSTLHEMG